MRSVAALLFMLARTIAGATDVPCYDERGEFFTMSLEEYRSDDRRPCFQTAPRFELPPPQPTGDPRTGREGQKREWKVRVIP